MTDSQSVKSGAANILKLKLISKSIPHFLIFRYRFSLVRKIQNSRLILGIFINSEILSVSVWLMLT